MRGGVEREFDISAVTGVPSRNFIFGTKLNVWVGRLWPMGHFSGSLGLAAPSKDDLREALEKRPARVKGSPFELTIPHWHVIHAVGSR